jgi:hypothetical protein
VCAKDLTGTVYYGHKVFFTRVLPEKVLKECEQGTQLSVGTFKALCNYVYSGILPADHHSLKELLSFSELHSLQGFSKRIEDAMLCKEGYPSPLPRYLRSILNGAWSDCLVTVEDKVSISNLVVLTSSRCLSYTK